MVNQDTETRLMFFMKNRKVYKYTIDEAINYLLDLVEELEYHIGALEEELSAREPFTMF
ncbi:MAG: hypothetical protein QXE51_04720 [Nitrososphaeria archaeon]